MHASMTKIVGEFSGLVYTVKSGKKRVILRVGFVAETVISRLDDEYCTTHGSDHDKQAMLT